jgi:DNA polymerase I
MSYMSNIIIFDCHAVCHMLKHSMGYLSTDTEGTGIIFGFLKQIKKYAKMYDTNKFLFAWDSRKSKRKKLYSKYRSHPVREITEEEKKWHSDSFKQFVLIRKEVLPTCGFYNSFQQTGYEADDIIASLTSNIDDNKIIMSGDEDLYQLLNDSTKIFDLKKKVEFTEEDFITTFGIKPKQWVDIKSIAGCSSDKIPGCGGIGELTAIKYLKGELKKDSNKLKNIENYLASEEYLCYNKLVRLPFEGTKEFNIDFNYKFDRKGFIDICKRFKFNSFLMSEDSFLNSEQFSN